ncbi:copine-3-like [Corticium candelabrum]|uniref:copine-3-like n=1 Tax=Corticium candelabrum TaxID=121492 RepID=UPI002E25C450|nr:copine-3-like [Corticium candelabrum]
MATTMEVEVSVGASSRVEMSVSCTGLVNMDILSKSDPMCVLFVKKMGKWVEQGRTETIQDNLNPKFARSFILEYHFEEEQPLKLAVFDVDSASHDLRQHDFIGEAEFTLADVVVSGQELVKNLYISGKAQVRGTLHVSCEEMAESKANIQFHMRGENLDKKDFFGKSDPYVEISRGKEDGTFTVVWRTEVIKNTLNPTWRQFEISSQKLCNADYDRPLRFTCWDWDRNASPDLIGFSESTSLRTLLDDIKSRRNPRLQLIEPDKKKKKGQKYKNSGILHIMKCDAIPVSSFVDYLRGGCNVSLMVAIDFTASNGDPRQPNSLHYFHPYQMNEYMEAIQSVGNVLAHYDSDQMFPVWGFGAKLPPTYAVSHCFPLNGREGNPEVQGVQGIMDVYRQGLSSVVLHGPTIFAQILRAVIAEIRKAPCSQLDQNYYILLIITDGVIHDMQNTIDLIVEASNMPLSIVIVGVGGADFHNMDVLDADDTPLKARNGRLMSRDIVQFVPLRQFKSQMGANFSLAREVLAEIPGQLASFMKSQRIEPNPPRLERHYSERRMQPSGPSAPTLGPQGQAPYQPAGFQPVPYPSGPYAPYQGYGSQATGASAPYPTGQPLYPPSGQPFYPPVGQSSYPPGGQPSYPPGGQSSYPPGGQPSYPPAGHPPYPPGGQSSYPPGGQLPYPPKSAPYQSQTFGGP